MKKRITTSKTPDVAVCKIKVRTEMNLVFAFIVHASPPRFTCPAHTIPTKLLLLNIQISLSRPSGGGLLLLLHVLVSSVGDDGGDEEEGVGKDTGVGAGAGAGGGGAWGGDFGLGVSGLVVC